MSPTEFRDALRETLLSLLWRQWGALGVATHVLPEDRFSVDLEALLVASAALSPCDQRLAKLAEEWLSLNRSLALKTRVVRMCRALGQLAGKHHVDLLPPDPEQVVGAGQTGSTVSRKAVAPALSVPATAQVNLRRLFGVNARSDVLLYLLSGGTGSSAGIARSTWFDQKAAYRILESWVAAGVCLRARSDSGDGYALVRTNQWLQLLGLAGSVRWLDWAQALFPLILLLHATSTPPRSGDEYLLSSLLRELHDRLATTGRTWGILLPDRRSHPGETFFQPASTAVLDLARVMAGTDE